jgi:hypothetical protein
VFIFGGLGCTGQPTFDGAPCVEEMLVDLWYFDTQYLWFPLGSGLTADSDLSKESWPEWQQERASWGCRKSALANQTGDAGGGRGGGGELWMFGGLRMDLVGQSAPSMPTAELWCYEYTDARTRGSWSQVNMPPTATAPAARYAAAAWTSPATGSGSAVAYIYGGIGVRRSDSRGVPPSGTQPRVQPAVSGRIVMLDDMWRFNGDKDNPHFTAITPPQLKFPGRAKHWPPAGVGDGWVSGQKLWLWTPPRTEDADDTAAEGDKAEEEEESTAGRARRRLGTGQDAQGTVAAGDSPYTTGAAASNQLWVFSVRLEQWERVGEPPLTARLDNGGRLGAAARGGVNGSCVSFRQTGGCSGTGPRQPDGDKNCEETIPCNGETCPSGYCECKGGEKRHPVDCKAGSHTPFTCAEVCSDTLAWPGPRDEALLADGFLLGGVGDAAARCGGSVGSEDDGVGGATESLVGLWRLSGTQ